MKVVFDTRPKSGYDDSVERYHFPATAPYLRAAEAAVGDWVLYREPRRDGGREAYVGIARVVSVDPDPASPGHRYAQVSDYLPFDNPVSLRGASGYREAILRAVENPRIIGFTLQGKSVRSISDEDFAAIVLVGLGDEALGEELASGRVDSPVPSDPGSVEAETFARRVQTVLVNRKVRDAMFRRRIRRAYDDRCALTGLRVQDRRGAGEVQAAHIWSVADGGPDLVTNGLALSGTIHWLFDHHLIGLTTDYRLVVTDLVPSGLRALLPPTDSRISVAERPDVRPETVYLARRFEQFRAANR